MTFYEELGIAADATSEEIRRAYKAMARLVHPDVQTDPKLREVAEGQMKRLGEMVGVLSNPKKRAQYDAELAESKRTLVLAEWTPPHRRPGKRGFRVPPWMSSVAQHWFGILMTLVVVVVGTWYFTTPRPVEIAKVTEAAAVVSPTTVPGAPRSRHKEKATMLAQQRAIPRPQDVVPTPEINNTVPEETKTPLKVQAPASAAAAQVAAESAGAAQHDESRGTNAGPDSGFTGTWLIVPPEIQTEAAGQYPPYYVELVLAEERGTLIGHYRSRHKIPDKAISPEVAFRLQGKPTLEKTTKLEWTSADGARGVMELLLRGPNSLSVAWWTTERGLAAEFGHRATLSSGTAALIRQVGR
jgi:hypothetical protein